MQQETLVHVYGTAGKNLGDNSIAYASLEYLKRYTTNVRFRLAWQGEKGAWNQPGVDEIPLNRRTPRGYLRLAASVREADVVILGGGSMIQDNQGLSLLRGMLAYMAQVVTLAKLFRKLIFTLPIGVDHLTTNLGRSYARFVLDRTDLVFLRDQASLDLAQAYARRPRCHFRLSADPAYLLDDLAQSQEQQLLALPFSRYAVLSLARENLATSHFMPAVKAFLDYWLRSDPDRGIVFLAMDSRPHEELSLYSRLIKELGAPNRVTISVPKEPFEAFDIIKRAELMVAMRLHAMILGLGYTPMVALSRTTKTDNFIQDNSIRGYRVDRDISPRDFVRSVLECSDTYGSLDSQRALRERHKEAARQALRELGEAVEAVYQLGFHSGGTGA